MGLESTTYIDGLEELWPTAEDFRREGDDHIRLLKAALKRTFPNVAGEVSLTHTQLNSLLTYVEDVEGNLISSLNFFPTGGIILWSGTLGSIPTGWALCNGLNGTPDLRNRFIVGGGGTYTPGSVGGADQVTLDLAHSHTVAVENHVLTTEQIPAHSHTGWRRGKFDRDPNANGIGLVAPGETQTEEALPEVTPEVDTTLNSTNTAVPVVAAAGGGGGHNHTATTASAAISPTIDNRPQYYALAYIMKLAANPTTPVTPPGA